MDSIQFLTMAFKKRFKGLFVFFFIIILLGSYQSVILNICFLSSVSEASPVPSLRFPRDLSRPPPAVSWICVSLFSLQLSSFSLIVILVRSISDTANVGPFRKKAREGRQKKMLYNIFLDLRQETRPKEEHPVRCRLEKLSDYAKKADTQWHKMTEKRQETLRLPALPMPPERQ